MTDYFVDATGGSNSNDGLTEGDAWQTLVKVQAETQVAGDSVLFKRGETWVFAGEDWYDLTAGVIYADYGTGAKPTFELSDRFTGWVLESGNVYRVTCTVTDHARAMLWENGVRGTRQTSLGAVAARGDFFLDDGANLLYYWASDDADPDTHTMIFSDSGRAWRIQGTDGVLQNLIFRYGGHSSQAMLDMIAATTDWLIDSCELYEGRLHGFSNSGQTTDGLTISNCVFDGMALNGITTGAMTNTLIDNNIVTDCHFGNTSSGMAIVGSPTVTISNNTVSLCRSDGIGFTGASTGGLMIGNTAFNNGEGQTDRAGLNVGGGAVNVEIFNNISHDNGKGNDQGGGINVDNASDNCLIHYNLCYNNADKGIGITGTNHRVYHNTCWGNDKGAGAGVSAGSGIAFYGTNVNDIDVRNNIFSENQISDDRAHSIFAGSTAISGATGVTLDFNLHFLSLGTELQLIKWNGTTEYTTLAAFVSAQSFEDDGVEADPLFIDTSSADFGLAAGSPAIDAGVVISGYHGVHPRGGNYSGPAPDMGAVNTWGDPAELLTLGVG